MREEYDFSKSRPNPFAERLKKEGCTIKVHLKDGNVSSRSFPPGTVPAQGRTIHVYSVGKNWAVLVEGAARASRRLPSQEEALKVARELARRKNSDIYVHAS